MSQYQPVEAGDLPFTILRYHPGYAEFRRMLREDTDDGWKWFSLAQWAHQLSLKNTHHKLIALEHLKDIWRRSEVVYYQHQLDAACKVVHELHGRAILADEVGLGKTIEAGLILKEYILRKLVRKALILTPASLCRQWQQELREKFDITAWVARHQYDWLTNDILIASIDLAKQEKNKKIILQNNYDLLIVDEAHKLKNSRTQNWQLVNAISAKYLLLLTATPVQNNLKELYNLITLLKPGQLGTYREFKKTYVLTDRQPKNSEALKKLLGQVMIRNRRTDSGVNLPKRQITSIPVELSHEEWELYQEITEFIRAKTAAFGIQAGLSLLTLQREVCSSPMAAAVSLARMHQKADHRDQSKIFDLLQKAVAIENPSKAWICLDLVRSHQDKVIIFTEYRATLQYLLKFFSENGLRVVGFDGSLSASRKQWVAHLFRLNADIMVSTESGSEGLNFQFCNVMINYDLPWNPLRLEQRIGRIHRLGQTRDVHVYNLSTIGTVEAHLLRLLDEKINMFNLVVGKLEALFGAAGAFKSFEKDLCHAVINAKNAQEIKKNFDQLAQKVQEKKQELEENPWLTI
ncbi:MAG: DEAD/DEAH box helicase [Firmicutes bacterium]|nr:DEAD/DEAH box helicase [Bacillota bacterium]